jgi:tetratricopeptide (TPR) repeat protein
MEQVATEEEVQMRMQPTGAKAKGKAQGPFLMTEKEVVKEIKSAPPEAVIKDVKERGVNFDLKPGIEKKLRKAKATDEVIEAVRKVGPTARSNTARMVLGPGQGGTADIPREQAEEFSIIKSELDLDNSIALVDHFVKKYPDSLLLSYVYSFGASSYQQKGDVEKVIEYSGKGLKLKPDDLLCLVLRIGILPQPQYLKNHGADRDEILKETQTEANLALRLISRLPKHPNEADADYHKRLVSIASQVHGSLGMVHLDQASVPLAGPDKGELAKAEQEFQIAVTTTDRPDPRDYYRLGEAYALDGKLDDAIQAYTNASQAGQGTVIKTRADQRVEELKKKKAQRSAAQKPSWVAAASANAG